jgi:hypothetical protein
MGECCFPHVLRPLELGLTPMDEAWLVPLPADATGPVEVFVNGVRQQEGADYVVSGGMLRFSKPLAREGRLGLWRWASMFFGVAGTYRKNDSVDVIYDVGGRRTVASGLTIIPPGGPAQRLSP